MAGQTSGDAMSANGANAFTRVNAWWRESFALPQSLCVVYGCPADWEVYGES